MQYRSIYDNSTSTRGRGGYSPVYNHEEEEDLMEDLYRQINNYGTRFDAVGAPMPEPENKPNWLMRALVALDKPRNALWNGLEDAYKQENDFLTGMKQGWSGEEKYYGTDLMRDVFGEADTRLGKFAQGVGGFAAEVVGDPLNLITTGVGSFGKGLLTGTAKSLGDDAARVLANHSMKGITREGAEQAVYQALKKNGYKGLTGEAFQEAVEKHLQRQTAKRLGSLGAESLDDLARNFKLADTAANAKGKGLSIMGQTLSVGGKKLTNATMQDMGASISQKLAQRSPKVAALQESISKMFNPAYLTGTDAAQQQAFKFLRGMSKGDEFLANDKVAKIFKEFDNIFKGMPSDVAENQKSLLVRYLEGGFSDEALQVNPKLADELATMSPETRRVADMMRAEYSAMLKAEQSYGLKKFIPSEQDYFPHVRNWVHEDNAWARGRKGGITGMLNLDDPYRQRTVRGTLDEAQAYRLYQTASKGTKQDFLEHAQDLLGKKHIREQDIFQLHREAPEIFDMLEGGISDFYEADPVKAYLSRALAHNHLIAEKQTLDDMLNSFTKKTRNYDDIFQAKTEGMMVVVKPRISVYQADIENVKGLNDALKTLGAQFDDVESMAKMGKADTRRLKTAMLNAQEAQGLFVSVDPDQAKLLLATKAVDDAYIISPGIYKEITRAHNRQVDEGVKLVKGMIDRAHQAWKPLVTGMRPDFHIRNALSSSMQNVLDVGAAKTISPRINHASMMLNSSKVGDDVAVNLAGHTVSMRTLRDGLKKSGATMTMERADLRHARNMITGKVETGNLFSKTWGEANKYSRIIGNQIEDRIRTVNFLNNTEDYLKRGMSIDDAMRYAGDDVKKFHFDYTDLTETERNIFRRVIPFYTWSRKNIPLQLELFLNDPAMYANIARAQRSGDESFDLAPNLLPDWAQEQLPLPTGLQHNDRDVYLNGLLPQADLMRLFKSPKEAGEDVLGMVSPLFKTPVELVTNRDFFSGRPISSFPGETKEMFGTDMPVEIAHIINQLGAVRTMNMGLDKADTSKSTYSATTQGFPNVMGVGTSIIRELDRENAERDKAFEYLRQLANYKQALEAQGITVPTLTELRKMYKYDSIKKQSTGGYKSIY